MTRFIKLHEANRGNSMAKDVYVRMHYSKNGSDGQQKTEYYFVKETFEEIEKLLFPHYAAPLNGA